MNNIKKAYRWNGPNARMHRVRLVNLKGTRRAAGYGRKKKLPRLSMSNYTFSSKDIKKRKSELSDDLKRANDLICSELHIPFD